MTEQEVINNIYYNENLINQFSSQVNNLRDRISRLEQLKQKFFWLQNALEERQDARRDNVKRMGCQSFQVAFVPEYCFRMEQMLRNSEFERVYNKMYEAREIIKNEQLKLQGELDSAEGGLNYRINRKTYWQNMLYQIRNQ